MYFRIFDKNLDPKTLYTNKTLANQITAKIDTMKAHKITAKEDIIKGMAETIASQMANKNYISKHLLNSAVDVRCEGFSSVDKDKYVKITKRFGLKIIDEGQPIHLHIEF